MNHFWTTSGGGVRFPTMIILTILAAFAVAPASPVAAAEGPTAEEVIDLFMAPCCFNGTLADHHSGEAIEMKEEIARMVAEGQSVEQIKAEFIGRYGERIMAEPVAEGINHLAVIMPVVALLLGGAIVVAALRRMRAPRSTTGTARKPPSPVSEDDEIEAMIREDS